MRDPKRIHEVCEALEKAWAGYPDLRLGQFLEGLNIFPATICNNRAVMVPFFQEDDITLENLKKVTR